MSDSALDRVAAAHDALAHNHVWYHTIDLAPGVSTPGYVDWRGLAHRVLPERLGGRRSLDVGTFDGFWSFEMESRGGSVVAIDVERVDAAEWPPLGRARLEEAATDMDLVLGRGFELAKEVRGSAVERVICNVYDLTAERIGGPVDFAYIGALLVHLRDPVRALERVRRVLAPGGTVVLCEPVSRRANLFFRRRPAAEFQADRTDFNWWLPNPAGVIAYLAAAGFGVASSQARLLKPPSRREMVARYAVASARVR